jgi:hypothetical protein
MEGSGQLHTPAASPPGKKTVLVTYEAVWAPDTVSTFRRRQKSIAPAGIWNIDISVVSEPTTLPQLHHPMIYGLFSNTSISYTQRPTAGCQLFV